MDETSYSDPVIVSTIGKSFIPIRVDTDQRPDINRRYNLGGWPTTAFLDANGKIITGGTYIPPQQLREVLRSVLDFYTSNKGKVRSKLDPRRLPSGKAGTVSEKIARDIATTIAVNFDIDYGGFGFEPKFPHPDALEYSMIRYHYQGEKELLTVVTRTLDRMAKGGMYDQVEQGFFRYSTTRDWSVPHFEKMAEDNAKLLAVYLHAFQLTGSALYKDKALGILHYSQAVLSDREKGGFHGSQDADEEYYSLNSARRQGKKPPAIDKTFYTNYNAFFVSSYLLASAILGANEFGKFALKTLDLILNKTSKTSIPFHYWRDPDGPMAEGFLVDYASLINALIDGYEYSGNRRYLDTATKMVDNCLESLMDNAQGGFYDIPRSNSSLGELATRDKPIDENSLMAIGLLRLSWHTGEERNSTIASKSLDLFGQEYERYGLGASIYAIAIDALLNGPIGITIVAKPESEEFDGLKKKALGTYSARRYISYLDPDRDSTRIVALGYSMTAPAAYVCVGKTCGPPTHSPSELESSLSSLLSNKPIAN